MRSKGDKFRRPSCYIAGGVENALASEAMRRCYGRLCVLITDDITAEVFQTTYLRITARYRGGDFVEQFSRLFWNTLKEYNINEQIYNATVSYAIPSKTPQEEDAEI